MALTHKSFNDELHNERLEFLGDAILSSITSEFLFETYTSGNEGFLTQMRSKIVSRETLNKIGKSINLHELIEIRENVAIKNSSILGNAFEAIIGATYIDLGYKKTKYFLIEKIIKEHINLKNLETEKVNFKSFLLEWAQKEKKLLKYDVVKISKDYDHPKYKATVFINGQPFDSGLGRSKKKAEQKAAEKTCKNTLKLIK